MTQFEGVSARLKLFSYLIFYFVDSPRHVKSELRSIGPGSRLFSVQFDLLFLPHKCLGSMNCLEMSFFFYCRLWKGFRIWFECRSDLWCRSFPKWLRFKSDLSLMFLLIEPTNLQPNKFPLWKSTTIKMTPIKYKVEKRVGQVVSMISRLESNLLARPPFDGADTHSQFQ